MDNPDWYAVRVWVEKAVHDALCGKKTHLLHGEITGMWIIATGSPKKERSEARQWLIRWAKREGYLKEL